jgi:hypothetical protein
MSPARIGAPLWMLWPLFFVVCFGLGYPTLNRYDPRVNGSDSAHYFDMVQGRPVDHARADVFQARVLVPTVARAAYHVVDGRVGSWNPISAAMLIANALFVSATASLLVHAARLALRRDDAALLAALLYLLNFAVSQLLLAGLVDSGEGFVLMLVVYGALSNRWRLLPCLQLLGATAKETFLPFSLAFLAGFSWAAWAARRSKEKEPPVWCLVASGAVGTLCFGALRRALLGSWIWPWNVGAATSGPSSFLEGLHQILWDQNLWYVFAWLLPLGLLGMRKIPRPWVMGSTVAACVAVAFGAWSNAGGTISRHLFNLVGPLLSLGAALALLDFPSIGRATR